MKQVIIYTDGSSLGNPGAGGWAALLIYNQQKKTINGNIKNATNNQMELTAAIQALKALKEPCLVELHTDSQYVRQGITSWIHNWKKNNWRSSAKTAVKNTELWQELDKLNKYHQVSWHWVKAHNGHEFNELVDKLAYDSAKEVK